MNAVIDLNADLGEDMPHDNELLGIVSSASIACGGHAGSPETMRRTLAAAKAAGVVAGAHPGFEDPEHFGRRALDLPLAAVQDLVTRQIEAISRIGDEVGHPVSYVKLHGALYNMAGQDADLAKAIFEAVAHRCGLLTVLALDNSAQAEAAEVVGLPVIREAFADRRYLPDGHLVPRSDPGAVYSDPAIACAQAIGIARDGSITTGDGSRIATAAQSICLHGDNAKALDMARTIRAGLEEHNIAIRAALPDGSNRG